MATVSSSVTDGRIEGAVQSRAPARRGKFLRYTLYTVLALVLLAVLADLIWIYSGSGEWVALPEQDGIKVYYLKESGTGLVKYKSVSRIKASLKQVVLFMRDPAVCPDVGCTDSFELDRIDAQHTYQKFTYVFPPPFKPRQYVVLDTVNQDPKDNSALVEYVGVPYKIPEDKCCVRVPRMNNKWKFTPLPDGYLQVEFVIDNYEGGFMPAFFSNYIGKMSAYGAPVGLGEMVMGEKYMKRYQSIDADYLKEGVVAH
jgi:hypothetical protein